MAELTPLHLMQWIEANRQFFQGPVANKEGGPIGSCKGPLDIDTVEPIPEPGPS